jgi:NitT/TauT family transport system permease protein
LLGSSSGWNDIRVTSIEIVAGVTSRSPLSPLPFFAALKTGGPLAILGVIGGEFIASSEGVGHELFTSAMNLDAATEFAGLIVPVVMTLILNGLLSWLDKYALKRLGLSPRRSTERRAG